VQEGREGVRDEGAKGAGGASERDGESELEGDGETKRVCYYVVKYMNYL
jgi:hypothetical protein